jgi:hypothetical protein
MRKKKGRRMGRMTKARLAKIATADLLHQMKEYNGLVVRHLKV